MLTGSSISRWRSLVCDKLAPIVNSNVFLDRIETLLKDRYGVATVVRHAKPSPTRMAKPEVRQDILSRCHGVVEAVSS